MFRVLTFRGPWMDVQISASKQKLPFVDGVGGNVVLL
jgi:hypothetical protein